MTFRHSIWNYAIVNRLDYKFVRNCKQRIAVKYKAKGCPFYIYVRGSLKMDVMYVKEFAGAHIHNVRNECEMGKWRGRRMEANLLVTLIEGKVSISAGYSPCAIMKDLQLEMGMRVSYMQCWRVCEYMRMLGMEKPEDHYKLLPWMCVVVVRANPDSRAFVELEGSSFKRMFIVYWASLNGFILDCRKILFVDGAHLNGLYEGTLLGAMALDANNHLYDVAYAVVSSENNDDREWFLIVLQECLVRLKPMVMSDMHQSLKYSVLKVVGLQNHTYYTRHMWENFITTAGKYGFRTNATKYMLKEMFNCVAYAQVLLSATLRSMS